MYICFVFIVVNQYIELLQYLCIRFNSIKTPTFGVDSIKKGNGLFRFPFYG